MTCPRSFSLTVPPSSFPLLYEWDQTLGVRGQRIGDFLQNLCCGRIDASSGLGPESPVKLPFVIVATPAPLMALVTL